MIEALEGSEPRQFVVAVQWHPERSYESRKRPGRFSLSSSRPLVRGHLVRRRRSAPAGRELPVDGTARRSKRLAEAGIQELPASCYNQFAAYLELLLRWNLRLSLTGVREPAQIIRRHFAECAFAAQHLPWHIEDCWTTGRERDSQEFLSQFAVRRFG